MPLSSGDTLGPYKILAPVGKGGMGEVYRAHDARLNRNVAIKQSAEQFSARFVREARSIAALNHSNICHLYDVGPDFLVMEYVEGGDLRGPLSFDDALPIIRQLIDGIEAAHDKGIVHRDLKPANIKITPEGVVKILDFGLAKAVELAPSGDANAENSPTLSVASTMAGAILGTAAYMAPEQAKGKEADRRSDIWAFGVILYELLTGRKLFDGESVVEILGAILKQEPDISAAPPRAHKLLRWCLEKDRKDRLQSIGDARRLLAEEIAPQPTVIAAAALRKQPLLWAVAAIAVASLAVATVATWMLLRQPNAPPPTAVRLAIPLPPGQEITDRPAISRDGRTVAYVARQGTEESQLYLRDLNSFEARRVAGSSGVSAPFFSPDGKWVAFFAQGQLQKAEVGGGTPIRLAEASVSYGGTWNDDNTIIYAASLSSGLLRIPSSGGTPEALTRPDGAANGYGHVSPQALPGGRSVLFMIWGQDNGAAVLSLESRRWQMVLPGLHGTPIFDASRGSTGRLLVHDLAATIRAAPFDAARPAGTTLGAALLSDVYQYDARSWLAVSDTGTAVYAPGNPSKRSLVWVDRGGAASRLENAEYLGARLSPDGTKASVEASGSLFGSLLTLDLQRGTRSSLMSNGVNFAGIWTPDGLRLIFPSNRGGDWDIYTQPADGSRPAEVLLRRPYNQFPLSISADGTVLFGDQHPVTGMDIWALSPDGKTVPLRVTPYIETDGKFSPDGRWVAYTSNESGQYEIYMQSYPAGANRTPVSSRGGRKPRWSRDGRELFYIEGNALVAVPVRADGSIGAPRRLFDISDYDVFNHLSNYDVSPDGQRFLMIRPDPGSVPRQLNVILNWADDSARPAPAAAR